MKKEFIERYTSKFIEMALIDRIDDLIIQVYTDHTPMHFHVVKKDKFEVRIDSKTLKVLSYKWQKNNEEISTKDLKKIKEWLKQKNRKRKEITNKQAIEFAWDILNNN